MSIPNNKLHPPAHQQPADPLMQTVENELEKHDPTQDLRLTRREKEVLHLLSHGLSNLQMAEAMVIAEGTLKRHVANLYQKLGVHNRVQAIRFYNLQK